MSRRRRVPLMHQMTATECAAACLAMVASYHGRATTVAECRELIGGGRDGVSVSRIVAAAPHLGLVPDVCALTDPFDTPGGAASAQPAIVYLTGHHFVVAERMNRRGVRVADPAAGRMWQSREDFLGRYGGLTIELAPGPDFAPRRRRIGETLLARYLREVVAAPGGRRLLAVIIVLAAALKGLGLAMPLATQYMVDEVLPQHRSDLLPQLGIAVLGTAVLIAVVSFARALTLIALRARADTALGRRFVTHLLRLPLPYFLQRTRGDLLLRLGSVSATREIVTQQVLVLVLDAALLVGYVVGLALVAPGYLPVVGALALAQLAILLRAYPRISALSQQELLVSAEEQSYLVETLEAIGPVKANGIEPRAVTHWDGLFGRTIRAAVRRGRATARVEAVHQGLATLAPLSLLWLAMALVLDGSMTLGTALAANAVALSLLGPVHTLASVGQVYPMLRSQIERMYDVMDAAEEPTGIRTLPRDEPAQVCLDQVGFAYQRDLPPVITDISLTIPPGAKVAIVGRTGSGKSTVALLILGLLRPDRGQVRHNGVDLNLLDVHDLRAGCGVVLQDLNLFGGTIRDNLSLGRPDATDADITRAAAIAGLHDDITRLPMGYDTLVGEGGAALSSGQRQRVALARALVHRPRLLVLDEATSHLDPQTERRVDLALSRLEVTRIVISHRVSAIRNADRIHVLDSGRLVQQGRHEDLITEGGLYQELFGDGQPPAAPGTRHDGAVTTTQGEHQ